MMSITKVSEPPKSSGDLPEFSAFRTALSYSAAIVVLPILSLFISKAFIFDKFFEENTITSNVCSAMFSIVILHVALGSFIYKAYSGTDKVTKQD